MSSRRKRAPPARVDEEAKKRLNWNMHEDRRTEGDFQDVQETFPTTSDSCQSGSVLERSLHEVHILLKNNRNHQHPLNHSFLMNILIDLLVLIGIVLFLMETIAVPYGIYW